MYLKLLICEYSQYLLCFLKSATSIRWISLQSSSEFFLKLAVYWYFDHLVILKRKKKKPGKHLIFGNPSRDSYVQSWLRNTWVIFSYMSSKIYKLTLIFNGTRDLCLEKIRHYTYTHTHAYTHWFSRSVMSSSLPPSFSVYGISQARIQSGLPFPSLADLSNPGIKLRCPAL